MVAVLQALCPRVFPDVAPQGTALPYISWQHIGGRPQRFVDGAAASLRHSYVQINVWAGTRAQAMTLVRSVEDALCAATAFNARPESEPIADVDADTDRRGYLQDFSVWGPR